jgi:putative membrane protein
MMYYTHDGSWWWLMAITSTIFWIALIAGIVVLVIWVARNMERPGSPQAPSARAILEERFARGEISADEFQERLRLIGGQLP